MRFAILPDLQEYSGAAFTEEERREIRRDLERSKRFGWLFYMVRNTAAWIVGVGAAVAVLMQFTDWFRGK